MSRLLTRYAIAVGSMPAANEAVNLTPKDPEVYRVRARLSSQLHQPASAKLDLERAVSLRPKDDYLWLELGNVRDDLDDTSGAQVALDQAVKWAPYYAHTRWQRANLKLRMGQYDEAFDEFRSAAASNPTFYPNLIDLAWGLSRGDVSATEQMVQIVDDSQRLQFARFLVRKGKGRESLDQLSLIKGPVSEDSSRDILRQLYTTKCFREAFELWNVGKNSSQLPPILIDGGFEGDITFDATGFGWLISSDQQKVSLSQDAAERDTGNRSLHVRFEGESSPGSQLMTQTLVVNREQRYRLSFAVKTNALVSGGLPVVAISDVDGKHVIAKSEHFPETTSGWQQMSFEFRSLPDSDAVVLSLQRNGCPSNPCPIFGSIWLDSFSIQEIKTDH
uniref:Uncharacterized protein n=1 Tax=uncultured bacterium F39-01 TaxID=1191434 RepID=I3VID5_9BACT|nr:unknown protein [uncultured bacterium F39-01]